MFFQWWLKLCSNHNTDRIWIQLDIQQTIEATRQSLSQNNVDTTKCSQSQFIHPPEMNIKATYHTVCCFQAYEGVRNFTLQSNSQHFSTTKIE